MIWSSIPFLSLLLLSEADAQAAYDTTQQPFSTYGNDLPSPALWTELSKQVGGRLHKNHPLAYSCFSSPDIQDPNNDSSYSETCNRVREKYLDEVFRSNVSSGYIYPQWETCQSAGSQDGCLLDDTDLKSAAPTSAPRECRLGSVPSYFIDLREDTAEDDAKAAFDFARTTRVPLVIKNTGHDYSGRSSAPRSLALWTHNLKKLSFDTIFVPEGCAADSVKTGITLGAGVQWGEAYRFADINNVTVVGGSDQSVGASGGWLQGGGHGGLSNTMGLGVDRVLQFKVVTPDGEYRVANACQNEDLFFALRGGGGGTFGVVLESTILASPRVTLQVVVVVPFKSNNTATEILWQTMAENSLKWADDGWGGWATAETAIYINPAISKVDASESMKPLIDMANAEGMKSIIAEFDSWKSFFDFFVSQHVAIVGVNLTLASRLISKGNFATPANRSELVSGFLATKNSPGINDMIMLISAPASFPGNDQTSVTPAWRDSLFHITVVSSWSWNSTVPEIKEHYDMVDTAIDHLRSITPDAAYHNEAAVHEPNHEVTFWGDNYPRLLKTKQRYDPDHLLNCWKCVGWDKESPQFSCYI